MSNVQGPLSMIGDQDGKDMDIGNGVLYYLSTAMDQANDGVV